MKFYLLSKKVGRLVGVIGGIHNLLDHIPPSGLGEVEQNPDYRREPEDLADAAALRHDKDYDLVKASGLKGAVKSDLTIEADIALVQRMNKIIDMFKNKEIDTYTGKQVSEKTYRRALQVANGIGLNDYPIWINGFSGIVKSKSKKYSLSVQLRIIEALKKIKNIDDEGSKPE